MSRSTAPLRIMATPLLLLVLVSACAEPGMGPGVASLSTQDGDVFFLTLPVKPNAYMEALYQGQVRLDSSGCIRLASPHEATVIWPFQSTLEERAGQLWVVDGAGDDIGTLGGDFRFGGGFVPRLHEGLGYSEDALTQIASRCPGTYWVVGETL